jgi:hypothetical protein
MPELMTCPPSFTTSVADLPELLALQTYYLPSLLAFQACWTDAGLPVMLVCHTY